MAPRLKDVAADAQVSVATVSRVLSGTRPVNAELRERVLFSARKHGYRPNLLARSLRLKKTFVLGAIVPSIANPYFTAVIRAVEDVAVPAGYVVTVGSSDNDITKERRHVDVLCDRMVDGALVTVADMCNSDLTPLIDSGIPVVLVDRVLDKESLSSVTVDTYHGAYAAVEHLVQRGYRRIGLLAGPPSISTANDKLRGYRQALLDNGLGVDERLIVNGHYTEQGGIEAGRCLLDLSAPPDAVLAASNQMTLGLFTAVKQRGLRMPQQIALIGFDDANWASVVVPPVTVVDQPTYELGRTSVQILLDNLSDGAQAPQHRVLHTRLLIRGSC